MQNSVDERLGETRRHFGPAEDRGAEDPFEGSDQPAVFLAAIVYAERLQYLGCASKSNHMALLLQRPRSVPARTLLRILGAKTLRLSEELRPIRCDCNLGFFKIHLAGLDLFGQEVLDRVLLLKVPLC